MAIPTPAGWSGWLLPTPRPAPGVGRRPATAAPVVQPRQTLGVEATDPQPHRPIRHPQLGLDRGHTLALVGKPADARPVAQPRLCRAALGEGPQRLLLL